MPPQLVQRSRLIQQVAQTFAGRIESGRNGRCTGSPH